MKSTIKPHFKFDDKVDNAMLVYNSKYEVNMHESMEEKIFLTKEFQIIHVTIPCPLSVDWTW